MDDPLDGVQVKKVTYAGKTFVCRGKRVKHCHGKGKKKVCKTSPHVYCTCAKASVRKAKRAKKVRPATGWTAARKKAFAARMAIAKRMKHAERYPGMDGTRRR